MRRPLLADSGMEAKKYFPELPCRIRRHQDRPDRGKHHVSARSLDTETEMSKTAISKQISSNKQASHGARRSSVCIIGLALFLALAPSVARAQGTADQQAALRAAELSTRKTTTFVGLELFPEGPGCVYQCGNSGVCADRVIYFDA